MSKEKNDLLKEFFETYIKTFLERQLAETSSDYTRIILTLVSTILNKPKELFVIFLNGIYNDKDERSINNTKCWLELHDVLYGRREKTPARTLLAMVNDTRFFGKLDISKDYIYDNLRAHVKNLLNQYILINNIHTFQSLPDIFYQAAANANYTELNRLSPQPIYINLPDPLFGNTLLHFSLMALGTFVNNSFTRSIDAVKSIKYLLERGANPNLVNLIGERPMDLLLKILPKREHDLPIDPPLQCLVTVVKYYISYNGILPSSMLKILIEKGYRSVANEVNKISKADNSQELKITKNNMVIEGLKR